ncbi:hypothetical protein ALC57_13012 [Trachymyrmex cornetzi]|uniref:Uncharacterized protein n=1 Tax=Trachymyrmex cornetzi TaxID=471704 RepID=A0A151J065_9HYME|nr:hypothetical protein ALC57_13012 [Trachymyrmex cornetzi]
MSSSHSFFGKKHEVIGFAKVESCGCRREETWREKLCNTVEKRHTMSCINKKLNERVLPPSVSSILRTMHVYDLTVFISRPFGYGMMLHAKYRTATEHRLKEVEAQVRRVRRGRNSVAPRRDVHPCSIVSLSRVRELLNATQKGLHLPPRCHKAGKINGSP